MNFNKINLLLFVVLGIVLFFTIPFYNDWLYTRILDDNMSWEIHNMDLKTRYEKRFGYPYTVFQNVANRLSGEKNVTVLWPPDGFMKQRVKGAFTVPEPAVFYYFTGLRSVWANSPDAALANWTLMISQDRKLVLEKMSSIRNPDSLLAVYKTYYQ